MDDTQRERALQAWELVVHDAPSREVLAAPRRELQYPADTTSDGA